MSFIYWIYFDKIGSPQRINARHYLEFKEILDRMIQQAGEMPEWIQRGYK